MLVLRSSRRAASRCAAAAMMLVAAWPAAWASTDFLVHVGGVQTPLGQADGVMYRFSGLAPGRYAVAVGHDLNGNRRVDTNLLGMPTEQWGVSNNARPALRVPRFEETACTVPDRGGELILRVEVAE